MLAQPTSPPVQVSFAVQPPGWHVFGGTGGALATSWSYRPNPNGWGGAIPPNGIVVDVFFVYGRPLPPLRLRLPRTTRFRLKGAPRVHEYRLSGSLTGYVVNAQVWVEIDNAHPSRALLAAAQRVVSGIRFR